MYLQDPKNNSCSTLKVCDRYCFRNIRPDLYFNATDRYTDIFKEKLVSGNVTRYMWLWLYYDKSSQLVGPIYLLTSLSI